jgi:hypothetical protein
MLTDFEGNNRTRPSKINKFRVFAIPPDRRRRELCDMTQVFAAESGKCPNSEQYTDYRF